MTNKPQGKYEQAVKTALAEAIRSQYRKRGIKADQTVIDSFQLEKEAMLWLFVTQQAAEYASRTLDPFETYESNQT